MLRLKITEALAAATAAALLLAGCDGCSQGALTSNPARPGSALPGGTTLTVTEWE